MKNIGMMAAVAIVGGVSAAMGGQGPLMGWSTWNTFGVDISEDIILDTARAMATNGLKAAGYAYVNIDDGFYNGHGPDGRLRFHPRRFPNGLKGTVDGIHALGLKAGIYSDAGADTCGSMWAGSGSGGKDAAGRGSGLYGHDAEDCRLHFNELGFDFIKVDYCGGGALHLNERKRYTEIAEAIRATGRTDVQLNVCRWAYPGTWISDIAGSWRTTGDIRANWKSVKNLIAENLYLSAYASPGHYNDMDMLEVGQRMGIVKTVFGGKHGDTGLTWDEEVTHFGMWCMLSSPLMIGCDVRTIPADTLRLITNPHLIALNQNRGLGVQGEVVSRAGEAYVLAKDADVRFGTSRYVALYNAEDAEHEFELKTADVELGGAVEAFDLVAASPLPAFEGEMRVKVAPHAARFFRLTAERRLERRGYEAETAFLTDYQELRDATKAGTAFPDQVSGASGGVAVRYLGNRATNDLVWKDVRIVCGGKRTLEFLCASPDDRTMTVEVDGRKVGELRVSATSGAFKAVSVEVALTPGVHVIRLSNSSAWMPDIDRMSVLPLDGPADFLSSGFRNPPQEAQPQAWYHMMNGNVTKAGVTRDFEALAEAGFGGIQMFDAGCDIPKGGLDFNSPEWFDLFRHAASEARRLGLEICIPNCSGWSSSGGPWNPASNAMKRVTLAETYAKGSSRFSAKLPREREDNGFYADIAVLAFPTPPAESVRFDGVETRLDGTSFTFSSEKPFAASGFSFRLKHDWLWCASATLRLEVSDDGKTFRPLETVAVPLAESGSSDFSLRYQPFKTLQTVCAIRGTFSGSPIALTVVEAHPEARRLISNVKSKTFDLRQKVAPDRTPATSAQTVAKESVLDLTARLRADDTLEWDVPAGDWTILRLGYVCNGRKNHPASDHGVGLEVDKLSAAAMDYHFEQYVARLCRALGPLAGRVESGLNNILVDSYEVGSQNWTQGFERTFKARLGYDLTPYLPVFTGRIVGSVEESERFLEDFRRVVADLFAENYAGKLTSKCRQYGLQCSIEPYGNCPADNLQYGEYVDIPMGEFWSNAAHPYSPDDGNAKYVSYIAHVWGKRICATESFTAAPGPASGRWMTTPFGIKAQGDLAFSDGVNRLIYHRFTHQPWADDRYLPGMTMGRWGMHLDRTQTWWPYAKPFFRYQARCQHLLQRGTFVADVLYFAGEEAPNRGGNTDDGSHPFGTDLPFGYDWDVCPTDAMHALKVVDGEVIVPGGVRYRVLAMPSVEAMTPRMLRTVARLQREGAKIAWTAKPVRAPGLSFGAAGDAEVRRLADEIFSNGILKMSAAAAIRSLDVPPQIAVLGVLPKDVKKLNWIHRREKGTDWFFVAMPNRDRAALELSFRVGGREPELWDAETGEMSAAEVWRAEGGRTIVRVPFDVCGSKFVVFRKPTAAMRSALDEPRTIVDSVTTVMGPWQVSFPHGFLPNPLAKGADEVVTFDDLEPWNERPEEGVRYFSGSATYRKIVAVPEQMREGARLILELGRVCEVAEVTVNGKAFDALWHPPFCVDITEALKQSNNQILSLSIRVANLWANRLIGDDRQFAPDCEWTGSVWKGVKEMPIKEIPKWVKDGQPSPTGRHTFTTFKHWDKDDALLPSGLLGPVKLHVQMPL